MALKNKVEGKKKMKTREYSLFTAIAMIVGTVIGSGIFFKSDNVLIYTDGDVLNGVLVFTLAALGIIFGSLTIAVLASKTKNPGGLIAYADEFSGHKTACAFGWFQIFVYYPSIIVVVAGIAGVYISMLFGFNNTPEVVLIACIVFTTFFFVMNMLSVRLGGLFQNAATIIKLIPLFIIAVCGMIFGDVNTAVSAASESAKSAGWLLAVAPIAFAYDGWVVSTSIAHEIKNSKRNLPIALVVGPVFILAVYIIYFIGICALVGPDEIMSLGDAHVNVAAERILGSMGAKIILVFVIVSVLGTVNGYVLGFIRLPYSLAVLKMFPHYEKVGKIDKKYGVPMTSGKIAFVISIIWAFIHYFVTKLNLMPNSDVSEIPIVSSYILYILLYVKVIKLYMEKNDGLSVLRGLIIPIIAIIGSLLIIIGGLANPMTIVYILICAVVIVLSLVYYKKEV